MSQELVYTSAPKGLKLGSRGFCTVASTTGMAKNLADRLETLTGYKHLFPPDSSQAVQNPVNYSYLRFALGGQTYYVLSRIADAGLDYTQRSNKLAHHLVLSRSELVAAGPAWLASQPGVFETAWSKDPVLLPNGRPLPAGDLDAGTCMAWQKATGDAGWAGVLAEQALKNSTDEAYLVYTPGTDVLQLFLEAQALLPPEVRWNTTFSAYFTKLPPGIECRWRGVVDGTPEALRVHRLPNKLVIDITQILPTPPPGELVAIARSGISGSSQGRQSRQFLDQPGLAPSLPDQLNRGKKRESRYSSSISKPPALPRRRIVGLSLPYVGTGLSRRERAAWIGAILILTAAFSALVFYLTRSPIDIPELARRTPNDAMQHKVGRADEPLNVESDPMEKLMVDKEAENQPNERLPKTKPLGPRPPSVETSSSRPPSPPVAAPKAEKKKRKTWNDVLKPDTFLSEVSLRDVPLSNLNPDWNIPITLASYLVEKPELELKLIAPNGNDTTAVLDLVPVPRTNGSSPSSGPPDRWRILVKEPGGTTQPLATIGFSQDDARHLQFQWDENVMNAKTGVTDLVRESVLRMRLSGSEPDEPRFISLLRATRSSQPIEIDGKELVRTGRWRFRPKDAENRDLLIPTGQMASVRLRLTGLTPDITKLLSLSPGQSRTEPLGDPRIARLAVSFNVSNDQPEVTVSLFSLERGEELFPKWHRAKLEERKRRLIEAIDRYLKDGGTSLWPEWNRLGLPYKWQQPNSNMIPPPPAMFIPGKIATFLKRKSVDDLQELEPRVVEALSRVSGRKEEDLQYMPLRKHEQDYPKLTDMVAELNRSMTGAMLHLHIVRIIGNDIQSGDGSKIQMDLFEAGKL